MTQPLLFRSHYTLPYAGSIGSGDPNVVVRNQVGAKVFDAALSTGQLAQRR
jgi:hypothetical protein